MEHTKNIIQDIILEFLIKKLKISNDILDDFNIIVANPSLIPNPASGF
jgi:hypothetical protein